MEWVDIMRYAAYAVLGLSLAGLAGSLGVFFILECRWKDKAGAGAAPLREPCAAPVRALPMLPGQWEEMRVMAEEAGPLWDELSDAAPGAGRVQCGRQPFAPDPEAVLAGLMKSTISTVAINSTSAMPVRPWA